MAIVFYLLGALGLVASLVMMASGQVLAGCAILGSSLFCMGFGTIIELLKDIRSNTSVFAKWVKDYQASRNPRE